MLFFFFHLIWSTHPPQDISNLLPIINMSQLHLMSPWLLIETEGIPCDGCVRIPPRHLLELTLLRVVVAKSNHKFHFSEMLWSVGKRQCQFISLLPNMQLSKAFFIFLHDPCPLTLDSLPLDPSFYSHRYSRSCKIYFIRRLCDLLVQHPREIPESPGHRVVRHYTEPHLIRHDDAGPFKI